MILPKPIVYAVNQEDRLTFVNDAWQTFAQENEGQALLRDKVLHRSLWDYIHDPATQQLYLDILRRVRRGRKMQFTLHCDSPTRRRLLQMTVRPAPQGTVEFESQTLQVEDRPAEPLLDPRAIRSERLLPMCSWCNRMDVGGHHWVEVEDAVERLKLFERASLPMLTHSICGDCFVAITQTLHNS